LAQAPLQFRKKDVPFTLQELAADTGGELIGNPALEITGAASLAEAIPGEISFYSDPRYGAVLRKTRASAVLVPSGFNENIATPQVRVANPSKAFEQIVLKFAPRPIEFSPGVHPTAMVDPSAKLGARVSIQPYVVIEPNVEIGDGTSVGAHSYVGHESVIGCDCKIYPRVTIRERTRIGARAIIHSGVVIGADGFGFQFVNGRHQKIPQLGMVQIDDDVEIGANSTIDRARFGRTWIQDGVKIDNLVQIAHNVVLGKNSIVAAQTGISGSTRVGEYVMMGGQVGVVGHVEIADQTNIAAQSGVSKSISGGLWFGSPAVPIGDAKRHIGWIHRLGKLYARVKALEEKLGR
jgi:UDP-3-O-[3-hydroxymyristoyl] glucosamine N-acyltransferase